MFGRSQGVRNLCGRFRIKGSLGNLWRSLLKRVDWQIRRENVHRHVHQYGTRSPAARQVKGPLHDSWQVLGTVYPVDPFAKWTVDLKLICILVEINFLVWVPAVIMRRYIARDNDHRDRIQRGIGYTS